MGDYINIRLVNTDRLQHIFSKNFHGDDPIKLEMGLFEKAFDRIFLNGEKSKAYAIINELVAQTNNSARDASNGYKNYLLFSKLSKCIAPAHQHCLTMSATKIDSSTYSIRFMMMGKSVYHNSFCKYTDLIKILSEQNPKQLSNLNSISETGLTTLADTLLAKPTQLDIDACTTGFRKAGKYKHLLPLGFLRAPTDVMLKELKRETEIQGLVSGKTAERYMSFQRAVTEFDFTRLEPSDGGTFAYAQFDMFKSGVTSTIGKEAIEQLTDSNRAKAFLTLMTNAIEAMYLAEITHRDLSLNNMIFHEHNGALFIKVFDCGHAKNVCNTSYESSKRFADINYLFNKISPKPFETIRRNNINGVIKPERLDKHYPMHKVLSKFSCDPENIDDNLSSLGNKLMHNLRLAKRDEEKIGEAFDELREGLLDLVADNTLHYTIANMAQRA